MDEEECLSRNTLIGMIMKYQNHGDSFGYKQHMQNSLLLNNTIGNGCFATLQQHSSIRLLQSYIVPPAAAMALGAAAGLYRAG